MDDNNCSSTDGPITIINPLAVTGAMGVPNAVSCNGGNDGSVTVTGSGGTMAVDYTYLWSDGQTTATASNLAAGNYSVVISDDNSCTSSSIPVSITELTAISQTNVKTHVLCNGDANGQIELTVSGGTAPYNISWSGAATGDPAGNEINLSGGTYTMSGLVAGDYDITIKDNNNCTLILNDETINQPEVLSQTNTPSDIHCFGGSDGSIDITVTGGTAPYDISGLGSARAYERDALSAEPGS